MKRNTRTRQGGYALILMVLALMGIGGIVMTGFTQGAKQEAEHQRYLHNQRVLREAKQALLQYAYNYPVNVPGRGPGRLPCPDTDAANDGDGDPNPTFFCGSPNGIIGRLPWAEPALNFYDARDASGERLWYAVSRAFANTGPPVINSDTQGTITIQDRSGAILHDGSAGTGVAAVIIAPGPPIERNGVMQNRPGGATATNYLDLFGAIDNADFVNNDLNGFVTGPIFNPIDGSLTVNDQMIVITAAEIAAMAEMATLQAYRTAINAYLDKAGKCTGTGTDRSLCESGGGTWNPVYPWLYNYDGIEYNIGAGESVDVAIDKLSTYFPADASFATEKASYLGIDTSGSDDGIYGRIPSMFANYFTETDSQPIESVLSGSLAITFPETGLTYTQLTQQHYEPVADVQLPAQFHFNGYPALSFQTTKISEVEFVDLSDPGTGRLTANFSEAEPSITLEMYFWDDDNGPLTGWKACGDDGDNIPELSDCHRASLADADPGGTHNFNLEILHVVVTLDLAATPGVVNFDMNYGSPPTILVAPATGDSHARIMATFDSGDIINGTILTVSGGTYEYDPHYHPGFALGEQNDGTFRAGSVDTTDFSLDELSLSIRYYPELPGWAFDNGWHNSIRMAYALEYEPPGTGPCIIDSTCLRLEESAGNPQDKISLLVIAGQHDWADDDSPPNGRLRNDLLSVFDKGNENDNPTFYRHRGNDKILVIDEIGP
jgi:hypothetical protein